MTAGDSSWCFKSLMDFITWDFCQVIKCWILTVWSPPTTKTTVEYAQAYSLKIDVYGINRAVLLHRSAKVLFFLSACESWTLFHNTFLSLNEHDARISLS